MNCEQCLEKKRLVYKKDFVILTKCYDIFQYISKSSMIESDFALRNMHDDLCFIHHCFELYTDLESAILIQ